MPTKLRAVEAQAMKLDTKSRAKLAQRLISSLDSFPTVELERAWGNEAESRMREIREGRVAPRPAAAVLRRVRQSLSRKTSRSTR